MVLVVRLTGVRMPLPLSREQSRDCPSGQMALTLPGTGAEPCVLEGGSCSLLQVHPSTCPSHHILPEPAPSWLLACINLISFLTLPPHMQGGPSCELWHEACVLCAPNSRLRCP